MEVDALNLLRYERIKHSFLLRTPDRALRRTPAGSRRRTGNPQEMMIVAFLLVFTVHHHHHAEIRLDPRLCLHSVLSHPLLHDQSSSSKSIAFRISLVARRSFFR